MASSLVQEFSKVTSQFVICAKSSGLVIGEVVDCVKRIVLTRSRISAFRIPPGKPVPLFGGADPTISLPFCPCLQERWQVLASERQV